MVRKLKRPYGLLSPGTYYGLKAQILNVAFVFYSICKFLLSVDFCYLFYENPPYFNVFILLSSFFFFFCNISIFEIGHCDLLKS